MEQCRICLGFKKSLISIYETHKYNSYSDLITSIAKVKITKDAEITHKICHPCRIQLIEAYDFKSLIERSDAALNINLKKINFSNIYDIKDLIKIENDEDPSMTKYEEVMEYFRDGVTEIFYSNTLIRTKGSPSKTAEPQPVLEFLKTIKEEPDDDTYGDNNCSSPFGSGSDDEEYIPLSERLKREKLKKKLKKRKVVKKHTNNKKLDGIGNCTKKIESKRICIKPVHLYDLRLIYSSSNKVKQNDKCQLKKKYNSREQMCPHCGKMTKSLNSHILQHIGERKFKCDKCNKGFFTQCNLNYHKRKHSTTKNFKCDQCVAAFNEKAALKSHMLSHAVDKNYVCDYCKKAFKRRGALLRHQLCHNSANKTIKCELCNMSFFTKYKLRHHLRVHTGERPYNCELCSQPYSYKHDFNRHCFKKHGIFLKRRSVNVMNEEVLKRERLLMKDIMLRVHGITKVGEPINPFEFEGPQAALAFEKAMEAMEANQISVDFNL